MKRDFSKQDFYDKLAPNDECLEWTAGVNNNGYGRTLAWNKSWLAHRLALHLEGIDITGYCVLHSCDNPLCCNPKHLRLGTQQDNMADRGSKGRTASKLTEEQVLEIRAITGMTQRAMAARYGVTEDAISKIINRRNWRHI